MSRNRDFRNYFYNLDGIHYNERKKNFHEMLRTFDPNHIAERLDDIKPRNYLEGIFYVDAIIYSEQTKKLLDILIEGIGVFTSRVLKQEWFIEEAFGDPDEIVNEILPMLSYSVRMKVLKQIAVISDEEKMDKIFELVLERYGIFIAQRFLFACSAQKFSDVLNTYEITLTVEQLKRITDKDFNRLITYLEYKKTFNDRHFLSYVLWKYPQRYFEFQRFFNNTNRFGRRTTKTILKLNEEEVLKEANLKDRFNIGAVARKVKDFQENFFVKYFPKSPNLLNSHPYNRDVLDFLKCYPKKKRWDMLSDTFRSIYKDEIENHLKLLTPEFIQSAPSDIMQKWAELRFRETNKLEFVMQFTQTDRVFWLVKERINVTSNIDDRARMLTDLIHFYQKSEDYATYEKLLKYITYRHRNEETRTRDKLMAQISEIVDYNLTSETFWDYVNALINVFRVNGDYLPWKNICQYLIFLHKKKLPMDNAIQAYIKDICERGFSFHLDDFEYGTNVDANMLQLIPKYIAKMRDGPRKRDLFIQLLNEMMIWNRFHKKKEFWIDLNQYPEILNFMKECIREKDWYDDVDARCICSLIENNYGRYARMKVEVCSDSQLLRIVEKVAKVARNREEYNRNKLAHIFIDTIRKPRTTEFQNGFLTYFLEENLARKCGDFTWKTVVEYLLTDDPETMVKYIWRLLPLVEWDYPQIKLYSHLGFDKIIIDYLTPHVSPWSTCATKVSLLGNLSKIMPTEAYIKIINDYIPQVYKRELMNSDQKRIYATQIGILKTLTNLDDLRKLIPVLHQFCQGDYFQSTLAPLYKTLYRIGEQQVSEFVSVLKGRAVSVRKHAIYLAFEILPQTTSLETLGIVASTEGNISAKKYLFQSLLKYFSKNPSDILFSLVIENITSVDKNDLELFYCVCDSLEQVAGKYKRPFVEKVWQLFDSIEKRDVNIEEYRSTFLTSMNSHGPLLIHSLDASFCKDIINKYFLSNNESKCDEIFEFVANYLEAYTTDEQFGFVFDIVKNYKKLHFEVDSDDEGDIDVFFGNMLAKYPQRDLHFFNTFRTHWEQTFNQVEKFMNNVLIKIVLAFKTSPGFDEFTAQLNSIFQQICSEHGPYIHYLLFRSLRIFLSDITFINTRTFTINQLILGLLKNQQNDLTFFLASKLLHNDQRNDYFEIVDLLKTNNSMCAKMYYYNLVKEYV